MTLQTEVINNLRKVFCYDTIHFGLNISPHFSAVAVGKRICQLAEYLKS